MTDMSMSPAAAPRRNGSLLELDANTKRRNAAEKRFRIYGMIAVGLAVLALVFLLTSIVRNGAGAFMQTYITLDIELLEDKLDKNGNRDIEDIKKVSTFGYAPLMKAAFEEKIASAGIETKLRSDFQEGGLVAKLTTGEPVDCVGGNAGAFAQA